MGVESRSHSERAESLPGLCIELGLWRYTSFGSNTLGNVRDVGDLLRRSGGDAL